MTQSGKAFMLEQHERYCSGCRLHLQLSLLAKPHCHAGKSFKHQLVEQMRLQLASPCGIR